MRLCLIKTCRRLQFVPHGTLSCDDRPFLPTALYFLPFVWLSAFTGGILILKDKWKRPEKQFRQETRAVIRGQSGMWLEWSWMNEWMIVSSAVSERVMSKQLFRVLQYQKCNFTIFNSNVDWTAKSNMYGSPYLISYLRIVTISRWSEAETGFINRAV